MTQLGRYAHVAKHDMHSYQIVQDTSLIKSTAGALLRQKIEKDESILKMTDKYNE